MTHIVIHSIFYGFW